MSDPTMTTRLTELLLEAEMSNEKWLCRPPISVKFCVDEILKRIEYILFPDIFPFGDTDESLEKSVTALMSELIEFHTSKYDKSIEKIVLSLGSVKEMLIRDAIAIFDGDPAASSVSEVVICYPGFLAVMIYRIAHLLLQNGIAYLPRMMTEHAHRTTGIDIHPAAEIGDSFCIDHGTGVVIGETARIGNRVKIYQGVTIGAKSFESDETGRLIKGKKRHPDIGDDCIIYANATILGGDTVIGDRSVIGGNVWLTHSVGEDSRVYYKEK